MTTPEEYAVWLVLVTLLAQPVLLLLGAVYDYATGDNHD